MLRIGIFSLLREIRAQQVRQDLPVQQDRQALRARMVQTVQQRALEHLLLLPDLSVLLLPVQIRLRYLRFLFQPVQPALQALPVQMGLQALPDLQVRQVLTALRVQPARKVQKAQPVLRAHKGPQVQQDLKDPKG